MSLGHYLWKNTVPGKGYGEEIDIDVDALPKTNEKPNVVLPNVYIDPSPPGTPGAGRIFQAAVPNFYFSPEGRLYHSTYYSGEQ